MVEGTRGGLREGGGGKDRLRDDGCVFFSVLPLFFFPPTAPSLEERVWRSHRRLSTDAPSCCSDAPEAKARKIVKSDNFTGQTNTVDVDKHMSVLLPLPLSHSPQN